MREVVTSLRLIPVGVERGTNQVHLMVRLTLNKVRDRNISRIHEMLIWKQFLFSQISVNCGDNTLITQRSSSGLDGSDQLGSIFIARLGKMHFVPGPERASLLAISRVEVIRRGNKLSCWKGRLLPPLSSLLPCFKLLLPDGA